VEVGFVGVVEGGAFVEDVVDLGHDHLVDVGLVAVLRGVEGVLQRLQQFGALLVEVGGFLGDVLDAVHDRVGLLFEFVGLQHRVGFALVLQLLLLVHELAVEGQLVVAIGLAVCVRSLGEGLTVEYRRLNLPVAPFSFRGLLQDVRTL